jgi:hypothetical protein
MNLSESRPVDGHVDGHGGESKAAEATLTDDPERIYFLVKEGESRRDDAALQSSRGRS